MGPRLSQLYTRNHVSKQKCQLETTAFCSKYSDLGTKTFKKHTPNTEFDKFAPGLMSCIKEY